MEIIIASNNLNKIKEIKALLPKGYKALSLKEIGFNDEIIENGKSFLENAYIKAKTIYDKYHMPVIADDSGLEVKSLNMQPGIYSHRFAGPEEDDTQNNQKLISLLKDKEDRSARYVSTICYIDSLGNETYFTDYCYGEITFNKMGDNGFGYDPYFYIKELGKTMAMLSMEEKNKISHRGKALRKLERFLKDNEKNINHE